jgi:hypothetical protein
MACYHQDPEFHDGFVGWALERLAPSVRRQRSRRTDRGTPNPQAKILGRDSKKGTNALQLALNGGDDYELLFTVNRRNAPRVPRSFRGLVLAQIGEITHQRKIVLVQDDGLEQRLLPQGWDFFRRGK